MGLRVPGEARESLSLIEMALRFPDQGVVVPGSSFWIADSGLQCVRTKSQWGIKLAHGKLESIEPYIRKTMTMSDPQSLFCYYVEAGGNVASVLRDLYRAAEDLEEEASRLGIIADGKFPMFEHGSVCLFHNEHSEWGRVRCQETNGSRP
jgi:hypothetical protein